MPSKKKSPYGGTLSQPHITPSPPSKVGTKIEVTFFGIYTPLPPSKVGKFVKLLYIPEMIFKETIFNHLLFTLSKYAKMAYKLQKM